MQLAKRSLQVSWGAWGGSEEGDESRYESVVTLGRPYPAGKTVGPRLGEQVLVCTLY